MPKINVNEVDLNYNEFGDPNNPTIVFCHALLWNADIFEHIISRLVSGFHIINLDLHGHGASGFRTGSTLEQMTTDYDELLNRLNLAKVSWIGCSIGGMLGMRLALLHPDIIESLTLISSTARLDPPLLQEQTFQLWKMFRDGHREDIADPSLKFFFAPATYETRPELIESYRNKLLNYGEARNAFEVATAVFNRSDFSERLVSIKVPTLAIAGRVDLATSPTEAEFIAAHIPGAKLAIIEDASHLLAVEKPDEVSQIIEEFLNEVLRDGIPQPKRAAAIGD
jgi:3-oxoadipate enol-lactonase